MSRLNTFKNSDRECELFEDSISSCRYCCWDYQLTEELTECTFPLIKDIDKLVESLCQD